MGATRMTVLNVDATFKTLQGKMAAEVKDKDRKRNNDLVEDLKEATPVDTGFAQSRWHRVEVGQVTNIINDSEYIEYLNQGSSKQAPAYFIESVALKYGRPLGSIVTVINKNFIPRG
jgi:hypothetical protein